MIIFEVLFRDHLNSAKVIYLVGSGRGRVGVVED